MVDATYPQRSSKNRWGSARALLGAPHLGSRCLSSRCLSPGALVGTHFRVRRPVIAQELKVYEGKAQLVLDAPDQTEQWYGREPTAHGVKRTNSKSRVIGGIGVIWVMVSSGTL